MNHSLVALKHNKKALFQVCHWRQRKRRVSPRLSPLICSAVECRGVSAEITGVGMMGSSLRRKRFSVVSEDRLQRHDSLWQILFVWPPDSCNWRMEYHYARISHQTRGLFLVHGLNHAIILHEPANSTPENLNFYDWASICPGFYLPLPEKRRMCSVNEVDVDGILATHFRGKPRANLMTHKGTFKLLTLFSK